MLQNPLAVDSIVGLFEVIIDIVMVFAVPIIVLFIVLAGFNYVTARGDTTKIQTAHKALLYALIGGLLIIGANVLIAVIGGTVSDIQGAASAAGLLEMAVVDYESLVSFL